MQEESMVDKSGFDEAMKKDRRQSPSKVHLDGHTAEGLLSVDEGELGQNYMGCD